VPVNLGAAALRRDVNVPRIHRKDQSIDSDGISKHRLATYRPNAYCLTYYYVASQYYVRDAAYAYRLSSVVCRSVCHTSEPYKTAAPIELPFGLRTWVGLGTMY